VRDEKEGGSFLRGEALEKSMEVFAPRRVEAGAGFVEDDTAASP